MAGFADMNKKIEKTITSTYNAVESGVVRAYKTVENTFVGVYKKIEDKFVYSFLIKDGETINEAKARLKTK
ncbi:MAG: hypothetical protein NC548_65700 [Lachnospiraceae bacterium]|nr:hypothetical protein [Lachnospiraceae bacterium]MCM1231333.1 hypothetical protein [Ruminococcus flavefaciens]